jgi:regulator of sigma E protease
MESVLEILSYVGWVLLAIMILVFVHEMGHFLFAKLFKMRVDRFSVGFPPNVLKKKIGDTEYALGATPLGGYVKIAGMVDESMDTSFGEAEPQHWEFRAKPVWQKMIVITAGVVFNFILAAVIFGSLNYSSGDAFIPADNVEGVYVEEGSILYEMGLRSGDRMVAMNGDRLERIEGISVSRLTADSWSMTVEREGKELTFDGPDDTVSRLSEASFGSSSEYTTLQGFLGLSIVPSVVGSVVDNSPAKDAGLQAGDRIVAIDSSEVGFWAQIITHVRAAGETPLRVVWHRPDSLTAGVSGSLVGSGDNYEVHEVVLTPKITEYRGEQVPMVGIGEMDWDQLQKEIGFRVERYSFAAAMLAGIGDTWLNGRLVVTQLARVATRQDNFRESMGGPIAIARLTKQAADLGAAAFWRIVALLSITLGIINILPIPALDGGHLMFLVYEAIVRREPSLKLRIVAQNIGMIVLLVFMVFLLYNDIVRF